MRISTLFLIGLVTSAIAIFLLAGQEEGGDLGSIGMYLVVFFLPITFLVILNTVVINFTRRLQNKNLIIILILLPIVLFIFLSRLSNLTIPGIDGELTFAFKVASIAVGVTNLLWIIGLSNGKIPFGKN